MVLRDRLRVAELTFGEWCEDRLVAVTEDLHGGFGVARALTALGVANVFTLSGGHIFPLFDAFHSDGIRIVDVRHEQTAGYAAEGWARLTRSLGVAALTAGPGVTNAMSPIAQAGFNGAPVLFLAGRAPSFRWGQGSLQEIDHVGFVSSLAAAKTVGEPSQIASEVVAAATAALTPPRGPAFLDFPLDVLFSTSEHNVPDVATPELEADVGDDVGRIAGLIEEARRPLLIAGSNVWMDRSEESLKELVENARIPVYMNGGGRGCLAADHELAFARSRSDAMRAADLVIVAGTPLDFRLGFGGNFGTDAKVVHLDSARSLIAGHVELTASIGGRLDVTLAAIAEAVEGSADTKEWLDHLASVEIAKADAIQGELHSSARPVHPMRIYGELVPLLDRDAVVVGDGGDFVSYAGREVPSFVGGRWLDPGPFGSLGCGPGYALAARLAYPDAQVVVLYGDGAIGFAGTDLETFVRHRLPVVCVVGNNGVWGLEKHPMRALYGYDVAADLQPGIRYDAMMESFGGRGELVEDPDEVGPALKRALASGEPYLVNVITDPDIAYPRSAVLA
jgi:acetolactate synthase I/II/III large subunit